MKKYKHKNGSVANTANTRTDYYTITSQYGEVANLYKDFIENSCDWTLVEEPKVILRTEDGVDIIDPEQVIFAVNPKSIWWDTHSGNAGYQDSKYHKFFSTKEARDEYILMNKPLLSLKESLESIPSGYDYMRHAITRLAKSKLK